MLDVYVFRFYNLCYETYFVLAWFTHFTARIQKERAMIMAKRTRNRKKTIKLRDDQLIFRFSGVHEDAELAIEFQRTLRIPDDNREHYLPPGLGEFPLSRVDDYPDNLPDRWAEHGGVFIPMYQAEALWINFRGDYPMAVKIAAGKVNAVTGEAWEEGLSEVPQDYLVVPGQPWLDGFCVEKGLIRQFVAMPLGEGYTVEEQLTGEAEHGGLQIAVYPMKTSIYEERLRQRLERLKDGEISPRRSPRGSPDMGFAPGGLMRQEIYKDEHGIDAWDTSNGSRCFVHIVNSVQLLHVTGCQPPSEPPTAQNYTNAGLPWYDYYGGDLKALQGAKELTELDSVASVKLKKGKGFLPDNDPVTPSVVKRLSRSMVREGVF